MVPTLPTCTSCSLQIQRLRPRGLACFVQAPIKVSLCVIVAGCSFVEQRQTCVAANLLVYLPSSVFPRSESQAKPTSVTTGRHTSDSLKKNTYLVASRREQLTSWLLAGPFLPFGPSSVHPSPGRSRVDHSSILHYSTQPRAQKSSIEMTANRLPPFGRRHSAQREHARPVERITDNLEVPSLDDRSYRVIQLPNQLEALLVHDAKADKAAASMDVNVGNFSDEEEMPGMAHAVEHVRQKFEPPERRSPNQS